MKSFMIELEDNKLKVIFKVKKEYLEREPQLLLNMFTSITDIAITAERFYRAELEPDAQDESTEEELEFIAMFICCRFESEEEREMFEIDIGYSFF